MHGIMPSGPDTHIIPKRALPLLLEIHGLTCPDCSLPMWHYEFPGSTEHPAVLRQPCPLYDPQRWVLDYRRRATVDHLIPRCDGGSNTWGNYQAVCQSCNGRRQGAWRRRHPDWRERFRARREASSWQ